MRPVKFSCVETLPLSAHELSQQLLDVANWNTFEGYSFIPAISSAEYEVQLPGIVGSKIRVTNEDGSQHLEEIIRWDLPRRIDLEMREFSKPLSRFATKFEETWEFHPAKKGSGTRVVRSIRIYPKSAWKWGLMWLLSIALKKAIARHLRSIRLADRDATPPLVAST